MQTTETTQIESTITEDQKAEGNALSADYKKREAKLMRDFGKDISDGGFDRRLGNLMLSLREGLDENQRISSKTIKAVGLANVPSQRRSEALRLVTENDNITSFLKENGKKYTSLTAMLAAFDKANKPSKEDTLEVKEGSDGETIEEGHIPTLEELVDQFIHNIDNSNYDITEAVDLMINKYSSKTANAA